MKFPEWHRYAAYTPVDQGSEGCLVLFAAALARRLQCEYTVGELSHIYSDKLTRRCRRDKATRS